MDAEQEYMITLARLQLPPESKAQRLTLALALPAPQEQFIQNDKIVKKNRVNFYRESLFVESLAKGLAFKVYEVTPKQQPLLLKTFTYSAEELSSVAKHAALFHTQSDGFELVWECSVFSAEESDLNNETDKEYTELRDNFYLEERDNQVSDICIGSHSHLENTLEEGREERFKKTNSTDDTIFAKTPEERNWREDEDFLIEASDHGEAKLKKIESEAGKEQYKKRTHIKSHIYSQLISEITQLFSGRR